MPPPQTPSAPPALASSSTPSPQVRKPDKREGLLPPSEMDKATVLAPGVCAWARMGDFPWWPTVLRRRSDVEPTLGPEDALPAETDDNRLVEFFNDNGRVAVMEIDDLLEYTHAMHLLEHSGADFKDVLTACLEADAFIRLSGMQFQRDAIGTAASKRARSRKSWYRGLRNSFVSTGATGRGVDDGQLSSSTVVDPSNRVTPSLTSKCVTANVDAAMGAKPAISKATNAVMTDNRGMNPGSNAVFFNRHRRRLSKSSSLPLAKRPRVEDIVNECHSAPTPLKLFLSPFALALSRTNKPYICGSKKAEVQRAHVDDEIGTGSGESTGALQEADVGLLDAAVDTVEKMQKFTAGLNCFLTRKKKLEEDVGRLNKIKMMLKKDNKELSDMNELLKTVNDQQQNLSAHCEKTSHSMKEDIAALRVESQKLEGKIAEQQRANDDLQRWFDEMRDTCADLRKERRELRMGMQSKGSEN